MTPEELEQNVRGYQAATVILAANSTGILAALCAGTKTCGELADQLNLDRRAVATVVDALACLGVIEREGDRLIVPRELAPTLDPSSPSSLSHAMDHQWHVLQRWAHLDAVLRTGKPTPRDRTDEVRQRAFILGMADLARRGAAALWRAVDLSGLTHLVDVGGGPGELALAALESFPDLRATVFDLPAVLAIAREYAAGRKVTERLAFHPGDALTDPIPDCDVALVSSLLHSYGPEGMEAIAHNTAKGVRPGGMVVIREFMWDDEAHSGPLSAAFFAVNMLSGTTAGRCWAPAEIEAGFGRAGFGEWRLIRLDHRSSLLVGVRGPTRQR